LKDYANIPVELCTYALKEHIVPQVRLYVYLKTIRDGNIKLHPDIVKRACKDLGNITPKTFKTHLNWLIANQWIVVNTKTNVHNIIGYDRLLVLLNFRSAWGALYEPLDFKNFKAFLVSVVVTNYMKKKRRMDKRGERSKGRSGNKRIPSSFSYNLPVTYFAQILNISKTSSCKLLQLANNSPWLEIKNTHSKLGLPIDEKELIKEYSDLEVNKIIVRDMQLCLQTPNLITSYIYLRRKRTLRKKVSEMEKK